MLIVRKTAPRAGARDPVACKVGTQPISMWVSQSTIKVDFKLVAAQKKIGREAMSGLSHLAAIQRIDFLQMS